MPATDRDDTLTMVALAALAFIIQDVAHEALGHAVVAWASGARHLTISTVALQSDISTRWISAGGTLVNLFFAVIVWLLLHQFQRLRPVTRYFLVLNLAAALFTGTGYFFFSGVANFGDWAAVISGQQPYWLWRAGLIVLGAVSYYASMLVVGRELQRFKRFDPDPRLRQLSWTPYFTEGALAFAAGLLNPAGFFYVIVSALPSTLGANAGLISLPFMMRGWKAGQPEPAGPIRRSFGWIITGAVASGLFIFVLGRGLSWSR